MRLILLSRRGRRVYTFAPCTRLTLSGSQMDQQRLESQEVYWAAAFFVWLWCCCCDAICAEHSRSHMAALFRHPTTRLHPYHFGAAACDSRMPECKETWFWTEGFSVELHATHYPNPPYHDRAHRSATSADASMLPWGFARALATQLPACAASAIVARSRPNFGFEFVALKLWFATAFGTEYVPEDWNDPMACPPMDFRHTMPPPHGASASPPAVSCAPLFRARSLDPSAHLMPDGAPCCPVLLAAHGAIPAAGVAAAWTFVCAQCGLGPLPPLRCRYGRLRCVR